MREKIGELLGLMVSLLLVVAVGLGLYDYASWTQYNAYWNGNPGALMLYGGRPDARYARALARMTHNARALGFSFAEPELVEANALFNLWHARWQKSEYLGVDMRSGTRLMADGMWLAPYATEHLDCAMAHELGHAIDRQTGRQGHPVLERNACLDEQQFADTIGRLLCGYEPYRAMMRAYGIQRPLVARQCSGSDLVH